MLKLTKKADYGLMAMKHLAEHSHDSSCSAKDISAAYGIPQEALAKILQRLAKAGLLHSQHGINGGYLLAREANRISAFEVIQAIDGPLFITSCITVRGECDQTDRCTIREPLRKVNQSVRVQELIRLFGSTSECVHRVAVMDDNDSLMGVITQSLLLRAIQNDLGRMAGLSDITARSMRMTEVSKLITVPYNSTAFDAFMKMHKECLSSLTVVSETGSIVENLSATDIKGALPDFKRLQLPVKDYLPTTRDLVLGRNRHGLVMCDLGSSLMALLATINEAKVHRIYVADEQGRPVGVISLTDICHSLLRDRPTC